jgi:hypothetical protein
MVRALVQPLERASASAGAGLARRPVIGPASQRSSLMRPGFGLLIAASVSVGLWAGLAKLALVLLR